MTFDPTTLTGKRLWLRAKDNGASGSAITTWTDQSGKGNSPTVAGGTNPTVATGATPAGGKVARLGGTSNFVLPVDAAMRGKVTSSGPWSANTVDYTADNVIDGATAIANGNTWVYDSTPAFWQIEPYTPEVITSYRIMPGSQYPTAWTFAGSNDGSSWTTLDTRSGQVGSSGTFSSSYTFSNATAYRYYRFNFTAANGGGIVHIAEIEFNGRANQTGSARKGEIWAVLKNANTNVMGLWAFGSDTAGSYYPATGTVLSEQFGVSSRPTSVAPGVALTSWRLYRVVQDGTNLKIYLDGTLLQTAAITPSWRSITPLIGSSADGVRYTGDIAEILYLDDPSDATQTANLIDYFNTEHGLTVAGGVSPAAVVTGTVAATLPALTSSVAGTATVPTSTGAVAATLPSLTASVVGTHTSNDRTGTVAVTLPALTASIAGTHVSNDQVGTVAVTLPSLTAAIAADYTPAPVTGVVDATLPALTGSVSGSLVITGTVAATLPALTAHVTDDTGDRAGTVVVTLPALSVDVVGFVPNVSAEPWTADLSQRTLLPLVASASASFVAPLAAIPPSVVERPITRRSVIVPDLTTVEGTRVDVKTGQIAVPDNIYDAFPVVPGIVGVPHLIIDGKDVTYFRDSRTLVASDRAQEPFGDAQLVVDLPQITTLDDPDSPELSWLAVDKTVHYVMQRWDEDGPTGIVDTLFHGRLVSDDSGNDSTKPQKTWTAAGDLWQAEPFVHQVRPLINPVDVGVQIPKELNGVTSRRYPKIGNVTTGIQTMQRGNGNDKALGYVQGLLGEAWTDAGRQWTVAKKVGTVNRYEMRLKKNGVDWTFTNGQRGVEVSLSQDSTQAYNVVWGYGQRSDGGVWMRKLFPDAGRTAPAYPYASPGTVMSIGDTDAGTLDGDGVSKWQRRAKALGFRVTVDGAFSSADAAVARSLQKQYGILVDGIVGPQTWAETFDVGSLGADPDQWIRLPLAWAPGTQEFRYRANGSLIGKDPSYDKTISIVSENFDMGTDVTLADGIKSAQQIIARSGGLTGTLKFKADPREGSRFEVEAGDRIKLIGYEGRDVVLHIADRDREGAQGEGWITVQVAEKATDAMTLAQIRQRNNANRADPSRRPGKVKPKPSIDPWDCESNAGHIERHALYGGLWTVIRIPMSEVGRISEISMRTTSPSRFSVFLFAQPITSSQMIRYVGANPLALSNPGEANRELLEDRFGWLQGWGRATDALGYYPGSQGSGASLSGRFKDSGVDYWSPTGYIYIAEFAASSCFIEGDMRAAPPEA